MSSTTGSALYEGYVMHCRLRPRRHRLEYRVFWLLLDLDEIDCITAKTKLFSRNRFNVFSLCDRDFGDGNGDPPRQYVEKQLKAAGIESAGGRILLLTMPRILGYAFNPLNVYFCYSSRDTVAAILYEVNNTFGQRHSYLFKVDEEQHGVIKHHCRKQFFVSPFMNMAMRYVFRVAPPNEKLALTICGRDDDGPVIGATLHGRRHAINDRRLARAFVTYPFLTLKVIAGIHWEALQLWLKGLRVSKRPDPPKQAITFVADQKNL